MTLPGFVPWPQTMADRYRQLGYWRGQTLGQMLHTRASQHQDREALVDGDRRFTYGQLDDWSDRVAGGLLRLGLRSGDRVVVQLPNVAEFLPLCFALFRLGIVPVLALPAHREFEVVHLARLSEAKAYVVADAHLGFDFRGLAQKVQAEVESLTSVIVVGEPGDFVAFAELEATGTERPQEPAASDVALLLLSGGTTGAPKLIPRTHDDYLYNLEVSVAAAGLDESTRYMLALPVEHNFALGCPGALGTLYAGGAVICCREPSPATAFAVIERECVNITALVPPLAQLWLEMAGWSQVDLSSLECLQVGGARFKAEAAARVEPTLGCRLQQVYGMAEGLLNFTALDDAPHLVHDSQGRPASPADELRVVDEHDREVLAGEVGELLTRGPYTIRGYYKSESYNAQAFTADGFYRTGDLVRQLPEGHLVVEGRRKQVINRGGDKVPVEEVENHLLGHPSLRDVAIVGIADASLGERSCACVIARTGQAPALSDLNAYLAGLGVAAFKLPDRLLCLGAFPTTALGKIDRVALARQAEAGRSAGGQA